MSNDNWGWRARIGMFIVGNEAVPEAEWWAMAPAGVSIHAARVTARAPWARWNAAAPSSEPVAHAVNTLAVCSERAMLARRAKPSSSSSS